MPSALKKSLSYIVMVLMLILLVLQFAPFWSADGVGVSIAKYTWLPLNADECKVLTEQLTGQIAGYEINSFVGASLIFEICFIFGSLICLTNASSPISSICPLIGSVTGIYSFLAVPALKLGSTCSIQLILCIVLLVVAAFNMYVQLTDHANSVAAAGRV